MQTELTKEDKAIWIFQAGIAERESFHKADRTDARLMSRKTMPNPQCDCVTGAADWSGSPIHHETGWECDDCGRIIQAD